MIYQAFVIESEAEEGIKTAQEWAVKELGMKIQNNPDVVILRYGLFSVDDARKVLENASSAPFSGEHKIIIISASRAFHEAQNALLKLFEEPPPNTYIFLVLPTLGGLLPTLRSRVQILKHEARSTKSEKNPAEEFLKSDKEERSAIIKKLTSGKDEEEKRELRDEVIAIVNGIEAIAYAHQGEALLDPARPRLDIVWLLEDIQTLRSYLYDRSAPVKMILEHISFVIPKGLI